MYFTRPGEAGRQSGRRLRGQPRPPSGALTDADARSLVHSEKIEARRVGPGEAQERDAENERRRGKVVHVPRHAHRQIA